jgi:hypothetical protein
VGFTPCLVHSPGPADRETIRVGHPLLDAFLEFVRSRARWNTVLATAFDLKVFFSVVDTDPVAVTTADVLAFIEQQRAPRRGATLAMTMIYARIADKTVADEYFKVTEKVEALYQQPRQLPATDEGTAMRHLRAEMHRRMLGNGYCARPVDLDCHFESLCESCTFFVTTIAFRPTLQQQRDDAERKGQIGRQKIFDGLLTRLDRQEAAS